MQTLLKSRGESGLIVPPGVIYFLIILVLFADGIKAQMAHAKSVNKKKNFEDMTDSPRHMPIGGERPRERDEVRGLS